MEKRNDSYKQTTVQSQARVLEMEQEKVQTKDFVEGPPQKKSTHVGIFSFLFLFFAMKWCPKLLDQLEFWSA